MASKDASQYTHPSFASSIHPLSRSLLLSFSPSLLLPLSPSLLVHCPAIIKPGSVVEFIEYRGIWDTDELYNLKADPQERNNLIHRQKHQQTIRCLRARIFQQLKSSNGAQIPLAPKRGHGANLRKISGSKPAEFPPEVMR